MTPFEALLMARCLGFMFRAPGFSHPSVPPPVRAGLAYALMLACAHGRRGSVDVPWPSLGPAIAVELAFGAGIGIAASALYDGAYSGGRAVDDYVGIRVSVPTAGIVAGAGFGRLWSLSFTAMFFALGGHRLLLAAFDGALTSLAPGTVLHGGFTSVALAVPATLLRAAIFVAGPGLVLAFTAQIALAAIGRIVPRFGVFPLTFPVALGCALLATLATFPSILRAAGQPWLDVSALGMP